MINILQNPTNECWKNGNKLKYIIVHHTASSDKTTIWQIIKYFVQKDEKSIHYIVNKNGLIVQMVRDQDRAWHVGASAWGGDKNLNHSSIGIEVMSDGMSFTDKQRNAVIELCAIKCKIYGIPVENVLRHADVATPKGRKTDIGKEFYEHEFIDWVGFQRVISTKILTL